MAKKRKRKSSCPRRKQMTQKQRLNSAKASSWLEKYTGKNPVQGYRQWFGVDLLCAISELKMLGHKVDPDYEDQIRHSVAQTALQRKAKKLAKASLEEEECFLSDWESQFAYIAGYTSGGAPYGVLIEEVT